MRFGMIVAAAAALLCASQADAARYYEFKVHGYGILNGYTAGTFVQPDLAFDSISTFSFDTSVTNTYGFLANVGSYLARLNFYPNAATASLSTINSPSGPSYSFSVPVANIALSDTLQAVTPSNTGFAYIWRPDGRYLTTVTTQRGGLVSVLARTTDVAPASLSGVQERLSITAVPEPATWAMMIVGVAFAGGAMRRRKTVRPAIAA